MSSHDQFGSLSGGMDTTHMTYADAASAEAVARQETRRAALANLRRPEEDDIAEILGLLDDDPGYVSSSGAWSKSWNGQTEPSVPVAGESNQLPEKECGSCKKPFTPRNRQVVICPPCVAVMVAQANTQTNDDGEAS